MFHSANLDTYGHANIEPVHISLNFELEVPISLGPIPCVDYGLAPRQGSYVAYLNSTERQLSAIDTSMHNLPSMTCSPVLGPI